MRGMILAAGRGERMGALTTTTPKPLLRIGNRYLIEYAIENLKQAGILDVVINVSYLAHQIQAALGDGTAYGMRFTYSHEPERLEVAGGIVNALPHLGEDPFVVMSGDIITDYPLTQLPSLSTQLAHLVLINNPHFNPHGDFGLQEGFVNRQAQPKLTFANIGIYRKEIFHPISPGFRPWRDVLFPIIDGRQVSGEHYLGNWHNVGTPDELQTAIQISS